MLRNTLIAVVALALSASTASAQYSLLTARAQVGGTGVINWLNTGADNSLVSNPVSVGVTNTALTATVSQAGETWFARFDQGTSWSGNFANGNTLLETRDGGPMTIMFDSNISAAGANFQTNYPSSFVGRISALDLSGNVLAFFNFSGNSTSASDGSAVFAGISSTNGNIRGVRFAGVSAFASPNDFAINNVSVNGATTTVPEPGTYALMASGLLVMAVIRRKARAA